MTNIPDNYKVLFVQGGASQVFASVPLNLLPEGGTADYIVSGQFSGKAYKEALKYGNVREVATSKADGFTYVPYVAREEFNPEASYVHICYNNTIYGTKFHYIPDTGDIPLVADMSSCILSEPVDVSKFGVIVCRCPEECGSCRIDRHHCKEKTCSERTPMECTPTMLDWKVDGG